MKEKISSVEKLIRKLTIFIYSSPSGVFIYISITKDPRNRVFFLSNLFSIFVKLWTNQINFFTLWGLKKTK
jgi:hypothetical protein